MKGLVVTRVDTVLVSNVLKIKKKWGKKLTPSFDLTFSANYDYVIGQKLSTAFSKYEKLGYIEPADQLDDEIDDQEINHGRINTLHSI